MVSYTALVVALTLFLEDNPVMRNLLLRAHRWNGEMFFGHDKGIEPIKLGSRPIQIRSSSKHTVQVTLWAGQYPTAGPCPWYGILNGQGSQPTKIEKANRQKVLIIALPKRPNITLIVAPRNVLKCAPRDTPKSTLPRKVPQKVLS